MKGSRVPSIIRELRGEMIDIIEWHEDLVTFAQSALAPARITRVSITHPGEIPHLDVIVEDEQLSLAIGKRGQNVRLAAELLHAKIDVRSESDVKDEVASALARMLQTELGQATSEEIDLLAVPGIDETIAANIKEAGLTSVEAILDSSRDTIESIEGLDPETAKTLIDWATEKELAEEERKSAQEENESETGTSVDAAASTSSTMGDQDFMAALSKAFQESAGDDDAEKEPAPPAENSEGDASSSDEGASDEVERS